MILYEAFIDICIFKLTFYEAFLTVAMQKCREGCTFSSKISASRRRNPTLESAAGSAGSADLPDLPDLLDQVYFPRCATTVTLAPGVRIT